MAFSTKHRLLPAPPPPLPPAAAYSREAQEQKLSLAITPSISSPFSPLLGSPLLSLSKLSLSLALSRSLAPTSMDTRTRTRARIHTLIIITYL